MKPNVRVLWAVVVVEAIIIGFLGASRYRVILQPTLRPVTVVQSPLELALEYEASEAKFEQLIKESPEWMAYRCQISGWPILASCAAAKKTNYVRLLIAHGADVKQAAKALEAVAAEEAVKLLCDVQSEMGTERKH